MRRRIFGVIVPLVLLLFVSTEIARVKASVNVPLVGAITFTNHDAIHSVVGTTDPSFTDPTAMAAGPNGTIYVSEMDKNVVMERLPNGTMRRVAGTGTAGFSGDGGLATAAELNEPAGVALNKQGDLFIADANNNRLRMVTPGGTISTIAGNGETGPSNTLLANRSPALATPLGEPQALAITPQGALLIGVNTEDEVLLLSGGELTPVAGGMYGISPTSAACNPAALAATSSGAIYVRCSYPFWIVELNGKKHTIVLENRPHAPLGGLAVSVTGVVYFIGGQGVGEIVGSHTKGALCAPRCSLTTVDFITDNPLGKSQGVVAPSAIVAAPGGSFLVSSVAGNGFASEASLIHVGSLGKLTVLVRS
jgi:hypothetical protein